MSLRFQRDRKIKKQRNFDYLGHSKSEGEDTREDMENCQHKD